MRFVGNVSALFVVAVSHGLDTNPAAVRLFRKRLVKGFGRWPGGLQAFSLFLVVGSKSNVSAVSGCGFAWFGHYFFFLFNGFQKRRFGIFRLRFRNGLGTKPAGVLPFRMRAPNTFFLRLAWWLAGFQVLRCAVPCLRQPFATFFLCF